MMCAGCGNICSPGSDLICSVSAVTIAALDAQHSCGQSFSALMTCQIGRWLAVWLVLWASRMKWPQSSPLPASFTAMPGSSALGGAKHSPLRELQAERWHSLQVPELNCTMRSAFVNVAVH